MMLTEQERAILMMAAAGMTRNEISGLQFTSPSTVARVLQGLSTRVGARNTANLLCFLVVSGDLPLGHQDLGDCRAPEESDDA